MTIEELRHKVTIMLGCGTRLESLAEESATLRLDDSELPALLAMPSEERWVETELADAPGAHVSLFGLAPGVTIPLHDHPSMTVLCKVLAGTMRVRTFRWVDAGAGTARDEGELELSAVSAVFAVGAYPGALHEITAITACAFFDLFSPYYDETARPCRYYRATGLSDGLMQMQIIEMR